MLAANTECWAPDEYHGFVECITLEEFAPGQSGKVKLVKEQLEVGLGGPATKLMERRYASGTADSTTTTTPLDLSALPHLSRAAILQATREHHAQQRVYSSVGPILISVNPYQHLPELYSEAQKQAYYLHNNNATTLPPHLYEIAAKAFHGVNNNAPTNQSIVFSGESGGGKTMASRLLTEFLVYCSSANNSSADNQQQQRVQDLLVQAVPLIESFGNAQTARNDNSSRFGCWTEIAFANGAVAGASLRSFNLEKSRVVTPPVAGDGQRNFHIFYQLESQTTTTAFRYLGDTKATEQDATQFALTQRTMRELLGDEDSKAVLSVLRGILALGNVEFDEQSDAGTAHQARATVRNPEQLAVVCAHLGLAASVQELTQCLVQRDMSNTKEIIFAPYSRAQAEGARDAMAKHLYGRLFDRVLASINAAMAPATGAASSPSSSFIGLLDMYGFEIFATNSLEQLCINYCNERILEAFNRDYILNQVQFYKDEGIATTFEQDIKPDRGVLDLLETVPVGILNLLDEECKIPKGSDSGLLKRMRKQLTHYGKFVPHVPQQENQFAIVHFASTVKYNVVGFLDKNRDTLPNEIEALLLSACGGELFAAATASATAPLTRQRSTSAFQKTSLCMRFRNDLKDLMDRVEQTETHFVRCIKPNGKDSPSEFHGAMVLAQLSYSGVLETCRLRQEHGYELRQTHAEFVRSQARFFPSYAAEDEAEDDEFKARALAKEMNQVMGTHVQVGRTLCFVSSQDLAQLEARGTTVHTKCVLVLQAFARMAVTRKQHGQRVQFLRQVEAACAQEEQEKGQGGGRGFLRLDALLNGKDAQRLFASEGGLPEHLPQVKRARELCAQLEQVWKQELADVERVIASKDMVKLQLWLDQTGSVEGGGDGRLAAVVQRARQALEAMAREDAARVVQRAVRAFLFRIKVQRVLADVGQLSSENTPQEIAAVIRRMAALGLAKHPAVQRAKQFVPTTLQRPNNKNKKQTGAAGGDYDMPDGMESDDNSDSESITVKPYTNELNELKLAVALARQRLQQHAHLITVGDATALHRAIESARKAGAQPSELEHALQVETELWRALAAAKRKQQSWWQKLFSCGGCTAAASARPQSFTVPNNAMREHQE